MGIIDIDSIPGISDPIQIRLDGKLYTCNALSREILDKVSEYAKTDVDEDTTGFHEVCARQLSIIFDSSTEEFLKMDARKLKVALSRVMEALSKAGESKSRLKGSRS